MAATNDISQVINLKPKSRNMVYHIFQIHSNKYYIKKYHNTNSPCPINAVKELVNIITEDEHPSRDDDYYGDGLTRSYPFTNIPFIQQFITENNLDEEITYADYQIIKQMILDYATTPKKALQIIDWMQYAGLDYYFIELIDNKSKYLEFITTHSRY